MSACTAGRGRGRQRQDGRRPQRRQVLAQHPVVGAEVVTPLRDAMRFVDGDERRLALGQHLGKPRHAQPFRRNEEELQAAIQIIHASLPRLRPVEAGVNPPHTQAERE